MVLKNIALKTAELGPVQWENVNKLQPNAYGFMFFIDSEPITKTLFEEEEIQLLGTYIQTDFKTRPTYKQIIDWIVQKEYPDGKENQMLRIGVCDPQNEEFVEYNRHVEDISTTVKALLK